MPRRSALWISSAPASESVFHVHPGGAGAGLWEFATGFYGRDGIAEALIRLQDREDHDVGLILFALWLGFERGALLTPGMLAEARAASAPLREAIVPLRALRRRLKAETAPDIQELREAIKAIELEGEKRQLLRLSRLVPSAGPGSVNVARENLALVLGRRPEDGADSALLLARLAEPS